LMRESNTSAASAARLGTESQSTLKADTNKFKREGALH